MNCLQKIIYDLRLKGINIKRNVAEKIYYKTFPDRVHDHEIAMTPIEPLRITSYDLKCINLDAMEIVPREMTECINEAQEEEFC